MTEWEVIEDNEEIKAEFRGYKEGMVRLKEGGLEGALESL